MEEQLCEQNEHLELLSKENRGMFLSHQCHIYLPTKSQPIQERRPASLLGLLEKEVRFIREEKKTLET